MIKVRASDRRNTGVAGRFCRSSAAYCAYYYSYKSKNRQHLIATVVPVLCFFLGTWAKRCTDDVETSRDWSHSTRILAGRSTCMYF